MSENRLLAALPPAERDRLLARGKLVSMSLRDEVYRAGGPIEHVYFPRMGVLSCVVVLENGGIVEVEGIGPEGMTGAAVALGATTSPERVFCQVAPCECWRVPAAAFLEAVASEPVRAVAHRYLRGLLTVAGRQAACNAMHSVEERCARWLLHSHDRVGLDEFALTHEFLAQMLGVRRATVSVTAGAFQTAGLIAYRHGRVTVRDRAELEAAACECYRAIRTAVG